MSCQMFRQGHTPSKYQTRGFHAPRFGFPAQIVRRSLVLLQQPQDAAFHLFEYAHPAIEGVRRNLEAVVEAAEDKARWRQTKLCTGELPVRYPSLPIVRLVAVGKVDYLLRIVFTTFRWNEYRVRDNVVHVGRAHRARIAEKIHLDRCSMHGKDACS